MILFWSKFVPKGPINNRVALIQVMAWSLTVTMTFSEPFIAQIYDTIGPFY